MSTERISNPKYIGNMSDKVKREFNKNAREIWAEEHIPSIKLKNIPTLGVGIAGGFVAGMGAQYFNTEVLAQPQKAAEVASVPSSVIEDLNYLHSFDNINGNSGAIWTRYSCDNPQDANHYAIGQDVFVKGEGFDSQETFDVWDTGQPGGASCDPNIEVSRKSVTTDNNGSFCVNLYTVKPDDCGEYTVDTSHVGGSKNDNYRIEGNEPTYTPEPTHTPALTQTENPTVTPSKTPTKTFVVTVTATATKIWETITATATRTATQIRASLTPSAIVTQQETPTETPQPICEPCPTCPPTEVCNPCEELRRAANAQETLAAALEKKVGPEQTMAAAQSTMAAAESTQVADLPNQNRSENLKVQMLETQNVMLAESNRLNTIKADTSALPTQIYNPKNDTLNYVISGAVGAGVGLWFAAAATYISDSKKRVSKELVSNEQDKKK
jgi:hypothetical protein